MQAVWLSMQLRGKCSCCSNLSEPAKQRQRCPCVTHRACLNHCVHNTHMCTPWQPHPSRCVPTPSTATISMLYEGQASTLQSLLVGAQPATNTAGAPPRQLSQTNTEHGPFSVLSRLSARCTLMDPGPASIKSKICSSPDCCSRGPNHAHA